MSRLEAERKKRLHIGSIQKIENDKMLVCSVTYLYKCPICGHGHFEVYASGLFRCFACSTTFFRKELI